MAMKEIQETTHDAFDRILSKLLRAGLLPDDLSSRGAAWEIFTRESLELTSRYDDTEELDIARWHMQDALAMIEQAQEALKNSDGVKALKEAKQFLKDAYQDLLGSM